jgi:hypothetical protein
VVRRSALDGTLSNVARAASLCNWNQAEEGQHGFFIKDQMHHQD